MWALLWGLKWSSGFPLLSSALGASSRSSSLFKSLFLWWTSVISRDACATPNAMAASTLTSIKEPSKMAAAAAAVFTTFYLGLHLRHRSFFSPL